MAIGAFASAMACGPSASAPPVTPATDDPAFASTAMDAKPGLVESDVVAPETIRPGDILGVKMIGATDLDNPSVPVDRSGVIHLPLVGDVDVRDVTLADAEARVQAKLLQYDRFSRVSLRLVEARGRIATVTGAVEKPGNIPLVGDARLASVLASAGGPKMVSDGDHLVMLGDMAGAQLVRGGKPLPIDFNLALEGNPLHNVRVQPDDTIIVPPSVSGRIVVLGNVNKARTMPYRKGIRLSEALADAGGLETGADPEDVRVVRGGYAHPRLYVASLKALVQGKAPDVVLAPGDIIYVSRHWAATVGDVLAKVVSSVAAIGIVSALTK